MTTTTKPGKRVATAFLRALEAQWKGWEGEPPRLIMDWDWLGYGGHPSIVWEEGPYEWAYLFPFGGVEEEYGFRLPDVSRMLPEGWYNEAITGWAVGVYRG